MIHFQGQLRLWPTAQESPGSAHVARMGDILASVASAGTWGGGASHSSKFNSLM